MVIVQDILINPSGQVQQNHRPDHAGDRVPSVLVNDPTSGRGEAASGPSPRRSWVPAAQRVRPLPARDEHVNTGPEPHTTPRQREKG